MVREGRESSEGRGPSAGQCLVLRAREESWLEVFSPTSRILPISLLLPKEGAHLEKIWKWKREGKIQILLLNTPIPSSHANNGTPWKIHHKKIVLTTNPTLRGLGGFSVLFLKVHIF